MFFTEDITKRKRQELDDRERSLRPQQVECDAQAKAKPERQYNFDKIKGFFGSKR